MDPPALGRRETLLRASNIFAGGLGSSLIASAAHAEFSHAPDAVVFCNPSLAPALHRVAALFRGQTGVPVRILATADRILAAQLARGERNDVFVALAPVAASLQAAGLAGIDPTVGNWRDRLVVARAGEAPAPVPPTQLPALLAPARLGVTDPTGNAIVDMRSLLERLRVRTTLVGELDTVNVAGLLARGEVDFGLVFATDQRAGQFGIAAAIPDEAYAPVRYAAVLNRKALSRFASPFLAFLATPAARARLANSGLEIET